MVIYGSLLKTSDDPLVGDERYMLWRELHKMHIVRLKQALAICLTSLIIFIAGFVGNTKVEAAGFFETLMYSAAAFVYINGQLNNLNDHHQADLLRKTQRTTGLYENDQKNAYLDHVAQRLMSNGLIKNHYEVYITPSKEFNAFCTLGRIIAVNRGAIDTLDEDEFAVVLGHEMGHGEHKDPIEGTKKVIGLSVLVDLYLQNNANLTSEVLGGATANYINNEVITMQEEWNADNAGFDYAVAAGYNPGGGAAAMVKMRSKLGELWHEGLSQVVSPNNHPKTTDRINNFAKRLFDYSEGHVTVKDEKIVQIDGVAVIIPVKSGRYLPEERAYLIAGNLAKLYHHNHSLGQASLGEDGAVYIGEQVIINPVDGDNSAQAFADKINSITSGAY